MRRIIFFLLCTMGLQACNTNAGTPLPVNPPPFLPTAEKPAVDHSKVTAELNAAQTKWQGSRPTNYQYTYQRTCFCPPEYTQPLRVTVKGNVIQQVRIQPGNTPLPVVRKGEVKTVEQLFEIIQKAINENADDIRVNFDTKYGYPTQITIDHSRMMADEETYISAGQLVAIK